MDTAAIHRAEAVKQTQNTQQFKENRFMDRQSKIPNRGFYRKPRHSKVYYHKYLALGEDILNFVWVVSVSAPQN